MFSLIILLVVSCGYHMGAICQPPNLILNFDINQTLIIGDVVQGKSPNDAIVDALSDQYSDRWDDSVKEPVDYNTYIKQHLLPNPHKDPVIKEKQRDRLCGFLDFLKETNHPFYTEVQRRFDEAVAAAATHKTMIFPSFYKLLEYLKEQKISYRLVFRSFGGDIPAIANELNTVFGEGFLSSTEPYRFADQAAFYKHMKNAGEHFAIRDNWKNWFEHNEESAYGKPFPIDLSDTETIALFFDDNARLNSDHPEKNAIAPFDVRTGTFLTPEEAINAGRLFPVDTLQALIDPDYFIKLVDTSL